MNKLQFLVSWLFKEKIFCGLDIGSHKIKAALSRVQDAMTLDLLAVNEVETRGLFDGSVNDLAAFSSAVGSVLDGLTKKTKIRFRDVYLGLGGELVDTRMSRALIPVTERGNKVIVPHDVKNARRQARLLGVRLEEEVICDFVRQFKVDDINIALNPVGLYGRKIEVETLLAVVNMARLRNISKAIRQAGYEVNRVFFSGEALSIAVLDTRHRQEGSVLVDIGARKTAIFIFKDGLLKHFSSVLFGGERMTERVAQALKVPFALAEDVKRSYVRLSDAANAASGKAVHDEILIKKEQGLVPVKRADLNQAVSEEARVLIEQIHQAIVISGYEGQLKAGVVVAGGGALLTGLMEMMETELKMPVVMARNIQGLNNASLYVVATSLAEAGYKGSLRYVFDTRKPKDWFDVLRSKAQELCNEYF
jgi:cell division protein FtsA